MGRQEDTRIAVSPYAALNEIDLFDDDDDDDDEPDPPDLTSLDDRDIAASEIDNLLSLEDDSLAAAFDEGPQGLIPDLKSAIGKYNFPLAMQLFDEAVAQATAHEVPPNLVSRLVMLAADKGNMDDAVRVLGESTKHADIHSPEVVDYLRQLSKSYNAAIRRCTDGKTADKLYEMITWEMARLTRSKEHTDEAYVDFTQTYHNLLRTINRLGDEAPEKMEDCMVLQQLKNEISAVDHAIADYEEQRASMDALGKVADYGPGKQLVRHWYSKILAAIDAEQKAIEKAEPGVDRFTYGPFLLTLSDKQLAVIALNGMMSMATKSMIASTPDGGVKFTPLANRLGEEVQAESNYKKIKDEIKEQLDEGTIDEHQESWKSKDLDRKKSRPQLLKSLSRQALNDPDWGQRIVLKVGAALVDLVMEHATFTTKDGEEVPAFTRHYENLDGGKSVKHFAVIHLDPRVRAKIEQDHEVMGRLHPQLPPMVCQPQPWTTTKKGGYLQSRTDLMRTKGVSTQLDALMSADLREIFHALDALSAVRWKVDPVQFSILKEVWNRGGGIAGIPSATDSMLATPVPDKLRKDSELDQEQRTAYNRLRARIKRDKANLNSLRCDFKLKLEVAESALGHPIWFPHNVDFRGRAYPVPPHFNHLAADPSRGLLMFDEKKQLGAQGLHWVKIHLANLYGEDKRTFNGRIDFVEDSMADIIDSVDNPLDGKQWWLGADEPWQCLLTARELVTAMRHPEGPEAFHSGLPVHQDGSCNGLQHYAALGRDVVGAAQVDLIPADMPQDVYSGVMELVKEAVRKDAMGETKRDILTPDRVASEQALAAKVLPYIERKTVKQTVMTSVYGVTFVGARQQIQNRLQEKKFDEEHLYDASIYLAKLTLASIGKKFVGADRIKEWLAQCAQTIASTGQDVAWVNPLGLPVVQPYRKERKATIKTRMQTLVMTSVDNQPVMKTRQKSAFPPNFVHSLDSTHMMLTALECDKRGISFAAVHDSYWTHGCDIPEMNTILREQFVSLHSKPLLEDLQELFRLRHPGIDFLPLPERGDLDLEVVKDSPYFFD